MDKEIVKLLEDIKKLTILQLVKGGTPASTDEIGDALGVTGRTIRNVATTIKKPRKKDEK
jgi:DNA-binding CsgD family transcriptional regulator